MKELTWDDNPAPLPINETENKAREYRRLQEQKKQIEAKIKGIAADLADLFPEDEETYTLQFGGLLVHMKRPETWKWDQEKLREVAMTQPAVVYVKQQLTVPRDVYESMSPADQDKLRDALVRTYRSPTFTIEDA